MPRSWYRGILEGGAAQRIPSSWPDSSELGELKLQLATSLDEEKVRVQFVDYQRHACRLLLHPLGKGDSILAGARESRGLALGCRSNPRGHQGRNPRIDVERCMVVAMRTDPATNVTEKTAAL